MTGRIHPFTRVAGALCALAAVLPVASPASARDTLSGRMYLTYQSNDNVGIRQEYFTQRYEATLRDRVFQRNDFTLTFYFDNAENLTTDTTFRRYRGLLSLENRFYSFSARYSPKQTITPLELRPNQEAMDNNLLLDIHVPEAPRLRLSYGKRERFVDGVQSGDLRELRGDLLYAYKIFSMGLNRYQAETENAAERKNTVTGGNVTAAHAFGPGFAFNVGYEYRLNEERRTPGFPTDVTNHNVTGTFTSRYRRLLLATLALSRREITVDGLDDRETTDDNDLLSLLFFPTSPVTFELSRTYLRTASDSVLSRSDYGTAQILANGEFWRKSRARLQVARRADIDSYRGVIPDHLYYLSLMSPLYTGLDLRFDASINEKVEDTRLTERFHTGSLLDLYVRPWNNLTLMPHIQYLHYGDDVSFTGNDRAVYGITASWFARNRVNLGADLSRALVTTGQQSESNTATVNLGVGLRKRATLNMSYGVTDVEYLLDGPRTPPDTRSRSFNVSGQVWLVARGSLSLNFTDVARDHQDDSAMFTASYRQDF